MKGKRNSQHTYMYEKKEANGNSRPEKYDTCSKKSSLDKISSLKEMVGER